jgi:hypothetical protein
MISRGTAARPDRKPVGYGILPGKVAGRLPSTGPVPQRAQD